MLLGMALCNVWKMTYNSPEKAHGSEKLIYSIVFTDDQVIMNYDRWYRWFLLYDAGLKATF